MTLHDAIEKVIRETGDSFLWEQSVEVITKEINDKKLFERKDKQLIPTHQVIARARAHSDRFFFNQPTGKIRLLDPNNSVLIKKEYLKVLNEIHKESFRFREFTSFRFRLALLGVIASVVNDKTSLYLIQKNNLDYYLKHLASISKSKAENEQRFWNNLIKNLSESLNKQSFSIFENLDKIPFEKLRANISNLERQALADATNDYLQLENEGKHAVYYHTPDIVKDAFNFNLDLRPTKYYLDVTDSKKYLKKELDFKIYAPVAGNGVLIFSIIRMQVLKEFLEYFDYIKRIQKNNNQSDNIQRYALIQNSQIQNFNKKGLNLNLDLYHQNTFNLKDYGYQFILQEIDLDISYQAYFLSIINGFEGIEFSLGDSTKKILPEKGTLDFMIGDIPKTDQNLEHELISQSKKLLKDGGVASLCLFSSFYESFKNKELVKDLVDSKLVRNINSFKVQKGLESYLQQKSILVISKEENQSVTFQKLEKPEINDGIKGVKKEVVPIEEIKANDYNLNPEKNLLRVFLFNKELPNKRLLKDCFLPFKPRRVSKDDLYPTINVRDLHADYNPTPLTVEDISVPDRNTKGALVNQDVILLSKIGKEFKPTLFKKGKSPIVVSDSVFVKKINQEIVLPEYLCYTLTRIYATDQKIAFSVGTIMPRMTESNLNKVEIILPSFEEQKKELDLEKNRKKETALVEQKVKKVNLLPALKHTVGQYLQSANSNLFVLEDILNEKADKKELFDWNERISPNPKDSSTSKDTFDDLKKAIQKIGNSFSIVKRIIDFEAEGLKISRQNLKEFIDISIRSAIGNRNVHFLGAEYNQELELEDFLIDFDEDQFNVLIRNFVENSIKHGFKKDSTSNRIEVELNILDAEKKLIVDLSNNGILLNISFQKFITPSFTTNAKDGSGLGGFLMNKIIENHGGQFSQLNSNNGVIFRLELPY